MTIAEQTLAQVETPVAFNSWIPTIGQMVMGFILPFALAFVAIPLESFVHAARTVLGAVFASLLNSLAFLFRLFGNVARYGGEFFVNLYDLAIFPSLWIERLEPSLVEEEQSCARLMAVRLGVFYLQRTVEM